MERIRLTAKERRYFRMTATYGLEYIRECNQDEARAVLGSLEEKGLVSCARVSEGCIEAVRLTKSGKEYLVLNPRLRNPVDWKWVITTAIAAAAAVSSTAVLLLACTGM